MIIKKMRATRTGDKYLRIGVPIEVVEEENLQPGDYVTWIREKGRYIIEFEKRKKTR